MKYFTADEKKDINWEDFYIPSTIKGQRGVSFKGVLVAKVDIQNTAHLINTRRIHVTKGGNFVGSIFLKNSAIDYSEQVISTRDVDELFSFFEQDCYTDDLFNQTRFDISEHID